MTTKAAKVTDTVARTSRAGAQTGIGFAVVDVIDSFHGLTTHQFGALVALLTIVIASVQNVAENAGWIPVLFKRVPDAPTPVVDTAKKP